MVYEVVLHLIYIQSYGCLKKMLFFVSLYFPEGNAFLEYNVWSFCRILYVYDYCDCDLEYISYIL